MSKKIILPNNKSINNEYLNSNYPQNLNIQTSIHKVYNNNETNELDNPDNKIDNNNTQDINPTHSDIDDKPSLKKTNSGDENILDTFGTDSNLMQ